MHSCFLKLFEMNIFPSHSNRGSSLPSDFIDQFLYKEKIVFKLIKIQLCEAKISITRVGLRTPATSKMEILVTIVKEFVKNSQNLSKMRPL